MTILPRKSGRELTAHKREMYERYCTVINWGRAHPNEFCSRFFGIELLDTQKYAVYNSWFRDFIVWLQSRNAGKTSMLAVYTMLRSVLIPFHSAFFLGNTGEQAKEVFRKIEKLARKEIESFCGCTDFFLGEIVSQSGASDGFVHNPASFSFRLFNGSSVNTLNSDIVNIKGRRANLVCFDEAGWFSDELFVQAENFVNQDENFRLGAGKDPKLEPRGFPRQLLYASSASDTSSGFYRKFRSFSKNMLMGDQRYFVCNFTVDTVMKSKFGGEPYPPLISRGKVEKALEEDRPRALRELYNKFSADSREGQLLTRREIMQHTVNRPPLLGNDDGKKLFCLAWDSARLSDNSVICIAQFINDEHTGWRMELSNVVSLADTATKKKTPKRLPDQVSDFKELLLRYNGSSLGVPDYTNILAVICDSGAGGQMIGGVTDYLVEDWTDSSGRRHRGLIDRSHKSSETAVSRYPDAADIIRLVDPRGNRNLIFESIERMVKLGVVSFPAAYDGREYLCFTDSSGKETKYDLSREEILSLAQTELLKTETVTMCRTDSGGNTVYAYPPDKRNSMHDDRVFAFGLLCYYLAKLRHGEIYKPKHKGAGLDLKKLCRRPELFGQ